MFSLASLAQKQPDRILYEVSSYDRKGRNAGDGFADAYYHYVEKGEYVVFDEAGPGVLVNFWVDTMDYFSGRVSFLFDDDTLPRFSLSRQELFSGTHRLFPWPVTASQDSASGGNFSMSPIPFKNRLKIRFSDHPAFYHFLFYRYKDGEDIESLDTLNDYTTLSCLFRPLDNTGMGDSIAVIPAGGQITIFSSQSAGTIYQFHIKPGSYDAEALNRIVIIATWDNAPLPQVFAPLGELIGCKHRPSAFLAYPVNGDSAHGYTIQFPMPFCKSATIKLRNDNRAQAATVAFTIKHTAISPPDSSILYFHAYHHAEMPWNNSLDYPLLSVNGSGCFAGSFLYVTGDRSRIFLEGDERFYADGRSFPDLYGTGLEDYLLAGWYFTHGPFALPFSGFLSSERGDQDAMSFYRFHISDNIPFCASFLAGIEKGPLGTHPPDFSSVAFYYQSQARTMVRTDSLVLGDSLSEKAHALAYSALVDEEWLTGVYAGDSFNVQVLKTKVMDDSLTFSIHIDSANRGALLRCVTDISRGGQRMDVFVDRIYAGVWQISAENEYARLYDADFFIPESIARGKDSLAIKIVNRDDGWSIGFNAMKYEVYTLAPDSAVLGLPQYAMAAVPVPDMNDGTRLMLVWNPGPEGALYDRIAVYRDTVEQFTPSLNTLAGIANGLSFTDTRLACGRKYYYRFKGYCGGKKTAESPAPLFARTPGIIQREAESLFPLLASASCSTFVYVPFNEDGDHPWLPDAPEGSDTLYSNKRYLAMRARSAGDSAVFSFFTSARDTFEIEATYCTGDSFGAFEALVNGRTIGLHADAYTRKPWVAGTRSDSIFIMEPGYNSLVFRSTGKNPHSAGYHIGLDRFRLSTLSERYTNVPDSLALRILSYFPNPFNPVVRVMFDLAKAARVEAGVFDVSGRLVQRLVNRDFIPQKHTLSWNGRDRQGREIASGVYFIRIRAGNAVRTVKTVLVR